MQNIIINPIKLASVLAHKAVVDELVIPFQTDQEYSLYESENDLMIENDKGVLIYKDDVQNIFDKYFDYFFNLITNS